MKMKAFDRVLIVLLMLIFIAFAALAVAIAFGFISIETVSWFVQVMKTGTLNIAIVVTVAALMLVIALRLIIVAFGGGGKPNPTVVRVGSNENGAAFITISTMRLMIKNHCAGYKCITGCEPEVLVEETGIGIKLTMSLAPQTEIPDFTATLQASLKENIERLSGVSVCYTKILIVPLRQQEINRGGAV